MSTTTAAAPAAATGPQTLQQLRDRQPPPLVVPGARADVRRRNAAASQHVVVLDDDPTGSQVVHDVPVLTRWDDDDLRWAFAHPARTFFVLTNSRSRSAADTRELLVDLDERLGRIAGEVGTRVALLSRCDSTLRGHFPLETDVLQQVAAERGRPYDAVLLVPAYVDAGRVTADDVHYARTGDVLVPVADTDYATDDAFGYTSSNLADWVAEKTAQRIRAADVTSLALTDIRAGGVERVTELLLGVRDGGVVVVNALDDSDLEVVALGLAAAEATGWRALCRVGPSFVPIRAGLERRDPLSDDELARGRRPGSGLVVVGSHVDLTTRQVARLLELPDLQVVELDVPALVDPATGAGELDRCTAALADAGGRTDVLLMTSRKRVVLQDGESSLETARLVSSSLVELTRRLVEAHPPGWVVAKGGITSHDIATQGLRISRATVLGQLFPGIVSVWRTEASSDGPDVTGLAYVVFAGNVGEETTLRDAVKALRGSRS